MRSPAVAIGPFQKTERRSYWAVSFTNIVTYGPHSLNPYYGLGSDGES